MNDTTYSVLTKIVSSLFVSAGFIHLAIWFGFMTEKAPLMLTFYFHSLTLLDWLAGVGIWQQKSWAFKLGLIIMVTQFPAHLYMMYLDLYQDYGSGVAVSSRLVDLILATLYLLLFKSLLRQAKPSLIKSINRFKSKIENNNTNNGHKSG